VAMLDGNSSVNSLHRHSSCDVGWVHWVGGLKSTCADHAFQRSENAREREERISQPYSRQAFLEPQLLDAGTDVVPKLGQVGYR
jgi:hypothetical protein